MSMFADVFLKIITIKSLGLERGEPWFSWKPLRKRLGLLLTLRCWPGVGWGETATLLSEAVLRKPLKSTSVKRKPSRTRAATFLGFTCYVIPSMRVFQEWAPRFWALGIVGHSHHKGAPEGQVCLQNGWASQVSWQGPAEPRAEAHTRGGGDASLAQQQIRSRSFKYNAALCCSASRNPAPGKHFQSRILRPQVIRTKGAESSNEPRFSSQVKILGKQIHENNVIDP